MTERKGLKKVVRQRMARTGESYTTAHRQVATPRLPAAVVPGRFGRERHHHSALVRHLLAHAGLELSEPMVCGLAGGVGFLYATFSYTVVPHPLLTIVAQHHPQPWAPAVLDRLGVGYTEEHSSSTPAAWKKLRRCLDSGRPALCTVDRTGLPWHSGANLLGIPEPYPVVVVGIDGDTVYLDDRDATPHALGTAEFGAAWAADRKVRHAMLSVGPGPVAPPDLDAAVASAIATTVAHLTGPVLGHSYDVNFGLSGLAKLATELTDARGRNGWARRFDTPAGLAYAMRRLDECLQYQHTAPDGTRPIYADFLDEVAALSPVDTRSAAALFRESGTGWAAVTAEARAAIPPGGQVDPAGSRALFDRLGEIVRGCLAAESAAAAALTPEE